MRTSIATRVLPHTNTIQNYRKYCRRARYDIVVALHLYVTIWIAIFKECNADKEDAKHFLYLEGRTLMLFYMPV